MSSRRSLRTVSRTATRAAVRPTGVGPSSPSGASTAGSSSGTLTRVVSHACSRATATPSVASGTALSAVCVRMCPWQVLANVVHVVSSIASYACRWCVASWSRDGRKLLSASSDWTVKLWDVLSGNVDQTLQLESAALFCQIHPRDPYATLSACARARLFSNMLLRGELRSLIDSMLRQKPVRGAAGDGAATVGQLEDGRANSPAAPHRRAEAGHQGTPPHSTALACERWPDVSSRVACVSRVSLSRSRRCTSAL